MGLEPFERLREPSRAPLPGTAAEGTTRVHATFQMALIPSLNIIITQFCKFCSLEESGSFSIIFTQSVALCEY